MTIHNEDVALVQSTVLFSMLVSARIIWSFAVLSFHAVYDFLGALVVDLLLSSRIQCYLHQRIFCFNIWHHIAKGSVVGECK
jgi:hypothetical protein